MLVFFTSVFVHKYKRKKIQLNYKSIVLSFRNDSILFIILIDFVVTYYQYRLCSSTSTMKMLKTTLKTKRSDVYC